MTGIPALNGGGAQKFVVLLRFSREHEVNPTG